MRSFNTRGAQAQVRLENFSGLQYRAPAKDTSAAYDLCNLRRMSDGTLSRREGFSPIATLPAKVRGAYSCKQDGTVVIYAVAGKEIYALQRAEDGTYTQEQIGSTTSSEGEVNFFMLDGNVVMMDGEQMYGLFPDYAGVLTPYIPLYGRWTSADYTTIYEPRNALTDQIHIQYTTSSRGYLLNLRLRPRSIEAVHVAGVMISPDLYTQELESLRFKNEFLPNTQIDVLMTVSTDTTVTALREDFPRCRCSVRPSEAGRTLMLLGGGNETGVLYLTRNIAKEDRKRCREISPRSCMLYLQSDGRMEVGDGVHGVTAMVRHYDRTLLMTAKESWTAKAQDLVTGATGTAFGMINPSLGCSTLGGALLVGNTPISICGKDVLRWSADTETLDECNATVISDAVRALLPQAFGEQGRVFLNQEKDEVWFYLPDGSARVFIWQYAQNVWTSFDFGSLAPSCVFDFDGAVGLASGNSIYRAVGDAAQDTDADGVQHPVFCSYVSHCLGFGHKGQTLRPYEAMVCVDADAGTEITVTLEEADGDQSCVTLLATGEHPCELQKRLGAGRCRHAVVRVDCAAEGKFTLRSVGVVAGL